MENYRNFHLGRELIKVELWAAAILEYPDKFNNSHGGLRVNVVLLMSVVKRLARPLVRHSLSLLPGRGSDKTNYNGIIDKSVFLGCNGTLLVFYILFILSFSQNKGSVHLGMFRDEG